MNFEATHGDKLRAVLENSKLPNNDKERVQDAIKKYEAWIAEMLKISSEAKANEVIKLMVSSFDTYKRYIDLNVIFDSESDFLYTEKGQTKIDNTIIEEFLPYLIHGTLKSKLDPLSLQIGPTKAFSAAYFSSTISDKKSAGGLKVRTKDQDFSIGRRIFIQSSYDKDFKEKKEKKDAVICYLAAECKTNLDKTMFQEAAATASDVKAAVAGAKYFLLCEWLDMPPISRGGTDIDEILLLRKAKRLSSSEREEFSTYEGRKRKRASFKKYLEDHPFSPDVFQRLIDHIVALIDDKDPTDADALKDGFF